MSNVWETERKEIATWLSGYLAMIKKWVDKILDNEDHDVDKNKIITPHIVEFHKIFPKIKRNINNIEKIKEARKLIKSNIIFKVPNTNISSYDKKNEIPKLPYAGLDTTHG